MGEILRDSLPTWTNKEVLLALGSAAAVLISALTPALIALHRFLSASLRHRLAAANSEVQDLKRELKLAREEPAESPPEQLLQLLEGARDEARRLTDEKLRRPH